MAAKAEQSEVVKRALFMLQGGLKADEPQPPESPAETDDPLLPVETWYPEFHRLHVQVCEESKHFDYLWLKENRPHLYREIKTLESQIDALQEARLSEVMSIMRQWRALILRAYFDQRQFEGKVGQSTAR